jgi:hypothetical protein
MKGRNMYNRVLENVFWAEPRIRCNCGSYALGVDTWFWPVVDRAAYSLREDEIRSLYICGYDEETIMEKLIVKDVSNILELCPWIEQIDRFKITPNDTIIAYRLALTIEGTYDEQDDCMYPDWVDEDFHFRIRENGVWTEKCGSGEIRVCDDQNWFEEEDCWDTGYMCYTSSVVYFRFR